MSCFDRGKPNPRTSNPKCNDKLVKVFTREEWVQLNNRIHASEVSAAKLRRDTEARENVRNRSFEIHKDWTNTILGARKKKLHEREERLKKEEEERVAVDLEWAKEQAKDRFRKLCSARNAQLYDTSRLKKFHAALRLGDALKENDLQLQLKELKREAESKKREMEYRAMIDAITAAEKKEEKEMREKKAAERLVHEFQRSQIEERHQQEEKEKLALKEEGEMIRSLAREAEKTKSQMREEKRQEQKITTRDLLEEIENRKKMRLVESIRDKEEDEKNLIYAVAKRQMCLTQMEKEEAAAAEWASRQQELAQNLSKLILQRQAARDISMEGALRLEEEKWQKRIEAEARKREEAKESMKKQREDAMRVKEEQMAREVEDGRAELQHNINLDEAAHREDAERSAKRLQDGRELAQIYLEEMRRHEEARRKEREADKWLERFNAHSKKQEDLFQQYAERNKERLNTEEGRGARVWRKRARERGEKEEEEEEEEEEENGD
ncbi:conserved hypothetical protein [Echinococcus multilocularis]|uniref:Trichohyalin-plectin-homology domain-containing protein n=1 Tax=Echinococcus multilocularis TaxID=6211 RepID=A0A068YBY0_ECHMU|nr:conserved hypothetical protein [Echinococcus multilocularis]